MSQDKISPEEKLLDLIKGNKTKGGERKRAGLAQKKNINPIRNRISNGVKRPRISLGSKRLKGRTRFGAKTLLVFIIILLFCLIGYESRPGIRAKNRKNFSGREAGRIAKKRTREKLIALKPYSYYAQEIHGKSIFKPLIIEKRGTGIQRTEKIEEMCKRYQVKGIMLGERPEAFIEDSQSRRTFTVTIGDIIGKIQVKDIKEGKVTLGYEEEIYDLFF